MKYHIIKPVLLPLLLIPLFFLTDSREVKAQEERQMFDPVNVPGNVVRTRPITPAGVLGTPHYNDDWRITTIVTSDGRVIENLSAKYNAFNDKLEVISRRDTLELDDTFVRSFVMMKLSDRSQEVFRNNVGSLRGVFDESSYLQVLFEGEEVALYKRHVKNYREPRTSGSGYDVIEQYGNFVGSSDLFYKDEHGIFTRVRLRQRNVLRLFGNNADIVRRYASQFNLDYSKEEDLIRMVEYYDSVIGELDQR